jgi:hypothetical protein
MLLFIFEKKETKSWEILLSRFKDIKSVDVKKFKDRKWNTV